MKITKRQLRRIIRETIDTGPVVQKPGKSYGTIKDLTDVMMRAHTTLREVEAMVDDPEVKEILVRVQTSLSDTAMSYLGFGGGPPRTHYSD